MSYTLILGDPAYSSWSLRAWLLMDHFNLPFTARWVSFSKDASVAEQMPENAPARTVPTLVTGAGTVIPDTIAIAEELASRHPDLPFWPQNPDHRAIARSLVAEMHSGFSTLRTECPMNLRCVYTDVPHSAALLDDVARVETLWDHARARSGADGQWLCGDYGIVDSFFAPVAARIITYGLPVGPSAQAYITAHLAHPAFRRWREIALANGPDLPWYARAYSQTDWPA